VNDQDEPLYLAALDLGSNSFHMIVGRVDGHDLRVVDRLKETVRLAAGLDDEGNLTPEAEARALECLERFGQLLRGLACANVRAVGTNTLRRARNAKRFRKQAREVLGQEVEIISGTEEARLIYLGVAHSTPTRPRRRLVVDIGGGSTELIVGHDFDVVRAHSLYMGCVGYSRRWFGDGELSKRSFKKAETAALLELEVVRQGLIDAEWKLSTGASGTVNAISQILRANGWSDGGISLEGLKTLRSAMCYAGSLEQLRLEGLSEQRRPVLAGGLAILMAVFKSLGIEVMTVSDGALREGVLYDLMGRLRHEDVRDRTIRRMMDQYKVDEAQAARVERTARDLLAHVEAGWELPSERSRNYLSWASRLHEIGLSVSYPGHQRHGAYLVYHTDMPGFSRDGQVMLACLLQNQRRKVHPELYEELLPGREELARKLTALLRIAVLLDRARHDDLTPELSVGKDANTLVLRVPAQWSETHPLTLADLDQEKTYLAALGLGLEVELGAD
jgi:exopolyphosphatase/guanosine-5'-triphosphate,3'-diphosphate pyrophosphatase